jgi:long-chain acyl-CoA synthetase
LTTHGNTLKIIDRLKNIFKLQQGEYVAPEKLENILIMSPFVSQIFVYGDSLKNYLVAIVFPKKEACVNFLNFIGVDCDIESVKNYYNNPKLIEEILNNLREVGLANDFKGFEIIKKITLIEEPFTIENNLLTPTLKIKRNEAKNKYLETLNSLYK